MNLNRNDYESLNRGLCAPMKYCKIYKLLCVFIILFTVGKGRIGARGVRFCHSAYYYRERSIGIDRTVAIAIQ